MDIHLRRGKCSERYRRASSTAQGGTGHIAKSCAEIFWWYGSSANTLHKESEHVNVGACNSCPITRTRQ